jgi:hypothetical protein
MKSLEQIEPRTPIASAPFTITNAGSYYLTANLAVTNGNAITIATNEVTLDLNGFTISSTAASATGRGIRLDSGLRNITILNGFIRGPGFGDGIAYPYPTPDPGSENGTAPVNTRIVGVSVTDCLNYGIYLLNGDYTSVESCTVQTVGEDGIVASVIKACSARDCGGDAISGLAVSDSVGQGTGYGVRATTAHNCSGQSTGTAYGILATTAQNCSGVNSGSGRGISAVTAQNCVGSTSSGVGVYATTAQNCRGVANFSGIGLFAINALGSYGFSVSGTGLSASNASFCIGERPGGTAIQATVATGCVAVEGTNLITTKYNMP